MDLAEAMRVCLAYIEAAPAGYPADFWDRDLAGLDSLMASLCELPDGQVPEVLRLLGEPKRPYRDALATRARVFKVIARRRGQLLWNRFGMARPGKGPKR